MDDGPPNPKKARIIDIDAVLNQVFQNGDISEIILKENNFNRLMQLRHTNRAFNIACLRKIGELFQKITIKAERQPYPIGCTDDQVIIVDRVTVNGINLKISLKPEEDEFLREKVGVKVQKLELKRLNWLRGRLRVKIHTAIMEDLIGQNGDFLTELVGMEDICPMGCTECTTLATNCQKYGPIQMDALLIGFTGGPKHFKELGVSDRLLTHIASHSIQPELTRDQVQANMKSIIPPITCDHLVLTVTEGKFPLWCPMPPDPQGVPREILNEILRKFKPKSIRVVVNRPRNWRDFFETEYFTEFKLGEQNEQVGMQVGMQGGGQVGMQADEQVGMQDGMQAGLQVGMLADGQVTHFAHVSLDLSNSCKYLRGFIDPPTYNNFLVANLLELFPTNHLKIKMTRYSASFSKTNDLLLNIAKNVRKRGARSELKVEVDSYPRESTECQGRQYGHIRDGNRYLLTTREDGVQHTKLNVAHRMGRKRTVLKSTEYLGKTKILAEQERHYEIRLTVWYEKLKFEEWFHSYSGREIGAGTMGFKSEFMDPEHLVNCQICQGMRVGWMEM